jgi:nucleotide-binding universal stress UspA family protein
MKMLEKILVATEFGQSQADTVRTAVTVARTFGSEILLVHVIPGIPDSPLDLSAQKTVADERLQDLRAEIAGGGVRVADPIVAVGAPFDEIIELADAHDVNVIMVGSGEQDGESPFCWGLTAEKLVRKARKPVWTAKAGATGKFNTILCPVDFSDPARRALTNAVHLARTFRAHLTVLAVVQRLAETSVTAADTTEPVQAMYAEADLRKFDRFLADFDFYNVRWSKNVRYGRPHEQILTLAREQGADLLVMGSTGRTGLARILMGSVAEKVLREVPCSAVTVKAEHAVRLWIERETLEPDARVTKGRELLEAGFASEAVREFQGCVEAETLCVPAWEGLADAHERLRHKGESERCRQKAERARESLENSRIQATVRADHWLWR